VNRLIERYGFDAVYFESSAYDFYDLNRSLAAGTSAREQVADAIGGLWSTSKAIDPLGGYPYTQASAGRIRLATLGGGMLPRPLCTCTLSRSFDQTAVSLMRSLGPSLAWRTLLVTNSETSNLPSSATRAGKSSWRRARRAARGAVAVA